jgi:hypothetical protein
LDFAVATELDEDDFVEAEADEIKGLVGAVAAVFGHGWKNVVCTF